VHREHDDAHRAERLELADQLGPVLAGHRQVDDGDIGLERRDELHALGGVARLTDDREVGRGGQERAHPLSHDRVIVDEEDADGQRALVAGAGRGRHASVIRDATIVVA